MCDEGETADRADAVRTESQKMESRAGETALDGSARSIIVLIVVGMLVGVLSGTFGIGGGTVIVPALVWLGLSQRNAAATSTLAIVPTSISGVISYATGGHVDWLADGKYVAESTGFNGDAVLSYELKDKSGNVVSASDSSTPVSGVRVKTAKISR